MANGTKNEFIEIAILSRKQRTIYGILISFPLDRG